MAAVNHQTSAVAKAILKIKDFQDLYKVPSKLDKIQPHSNGVWNSNGIGINPNGKRSQIVYTYKWCNINVIQKLQDGEPSG